MAKFPASHAIFFTNDAALKAGALLKQPDLAATYRGIAKSGGNWFYRGPFAKATGAWMKSHGGVMTAKDFADYHIELREPVESTYRGYRVVSFPPPSSGGVHVLEMLNILEKFDLKKMDEASRLHVIAEAMKLAFADRAYWLGDPDYAKVPRGLITKAYAVEPGEENRPRPRQRRARTRPAAGLGRRYFQETHHALLRGGRRRATGSRAPRPSTPASAPRSSSPAPASC